MIVLSVDCYQQLYNKIHELVSVAHMNIIDII